MTEQQITSTWKFSEIMVSVICLTYNHENYIRDTLNGFLMQKTNFRFEVLVNEDASTDSTAKILKEYEEKYPQIIKPIYHDVNEYSQGIDIFGNVAKLAKGKYIAICEGDDYWIDENKLQMQVDFLEGNPEYGLVHSKAKVYIQAKNKFSEETLGRNAISLQDYITNGTPIITPTTCIRKEALFNYLNEIQPEKKNWLIGDKPLWMYFVYKYKTHFFNVETSVYRVLEKSASHSLNMSDTIAFLKNSNEITDYMLNFFHETNLILPDTQKWYRDNFFWSLDKCINEYTSINLNNVNALYKELKNKELKIKILHLIIQFKIFAKLIKLKRSSRH